MSKVFDVKKVFAKKLAKSSKAIFRGRFLRLNQKFFLVLPIILVFGLFILYFNSAKTESAVFYPESCLGGWENPQQAQGEPEAEFFANYDASNSAMLFNSLAEIYCGGFSGQIPESSQPERIFLKLNLVVRPQVEESATTSEELNPEALNIGTTTEILPESQASSSPLGFWQKIFGFGFVHAEEVVSPASSLEPSPSETILPLASESSLPEETPPPTGGPEPIISIEPSPEVSLEVSSSTSPLPAITPDLLSLPEETPPPTGGPEPIISIEPSPEVSLEVSSSTSPLPFVSESTALEVTEEPEPITEILEVFYSFDGSSWQSIGQLGIFDFENKLFELPTFDWGKINDLQIKIVHLPSEAEEIIFLESLRLEVFYQREESQGDLLEVIFSNNFQKAEPTPASTTLNLEASQTSTTEDLLAQEQSSSTEIFEPAVSVLADLLGISPLPSSLPVFDSSAPVQKKAVIKDVVVDKRAQHSCLIKPFEIYLTAGDSAEIKISFSRTNNDLAAVESASLPYGISVTFPNGQDIYQFSGNEVFAQVKAESDAQNGVFSIPLVFREKTAVLCQFVLSL